MVMVNCCWGGVTWPWPPSFVWWWWDVSKGRGGIEGTHYDDDDDKYHHHASSFVIVVFHAIETVCVAGCRGNGWCGQWGLAVVLSVDRGFGGLLTFWLHSLLPHFPAIVIIVVAAADSIDGVHHYHQTSWHVQKVLLTCHIVTVMGCRASWCLPGCCGIVASFCCGWCHWHVPWLNEGCGRW